MMRNSLCRQMLVLVISLVIGLGIGMLTAVTVKPDRNPSTPAQHLVAKETSPTETQRTVTRETRPSRNAALPTERSEQIAARIAVIRSGIKPRPKGTGIICGVVRTEDGRPVQGVTVTAALRDCEPYSDDDITEHDRLKSGFSEDMMYREIDRILSKSINAEDETASSITDSSGRYFLTGLKDEFHYLCAERDSYHIQETWGMQEQAVFTGATVDFTALELISIPCRILMPDGTEAEDGKIDDHMLDPFSDTPDNPYYQWNAEKRVLMAQRKSYCNIVARAKDTSQNNIYLRSTPVSFDASEKPVPELVFRLKNPNGIMGTLTVPENDFRKETWRVYMVKWEKPDPPPPEAFLDDRIARYPRQTRVYSTPVGRYNFANLNPGKYFVWVAENADVLASGFATVSNRMEQLDLVIPSFDAASGGVAWIYGPDGNLLSNVSITASAKIETKLRKRKYTSTRNGRNPAGSFWFAHAAKNATAVKQKTHSLKIVSAEYGVMIVDYDPLEKSDIAVRFAQPATLDICLDGVPDQDHINIVSFCLKQKQNDEVISVRNSELRNSGATGKATMKNLAPGYYQLYINISGFSLPEQNIALRSGQNTHTVEMPNLYSVTVKLKEGNEAWDLHLSSRGIRKEDIVTPGKEITFSGLPAAKYNLQATSRRKRQTFSISVPDQNEVWLYPNKNGLQTMIDEPNGYLASKGLKSGDLVYAINDAFLDDISEPNELFSGLESMEIVDLSVLRGEHAFLVTVDPERVQDLQSGGSFDAVHVIWD